MNGEEFDEISFYESLIKERPDFGDALRALGEAYSKRGLYEKGREVDERLARLRPDDPVVHYNLACDYSLLKNPEECLKSLERAIQLGYGDFHYMAIDPDLRYIRHDSRFKELVTKYVTGPDT
jgi:tetratricopeptide (TPR) repeat protein